MYFYVMLHLHIQVYRFPNQFLSSRIAEERRQNQTSNIYSDTMLF